MRSLMAGKKTVTLLASLLTFSFAGAIQAEQHASVANFTAKGELQIPQDYREWIFAGANVSPHELNNGKAPFNEMRTIYIDRKGFSEWKKSGKFPEGTMLIKEVMGATRYHGPTGSGYGAGEIAGVAVMLKDTARHSDEFGGWGFYRFPKIKDSSKFKRTSEQYAKERCALCHKATAEDDMVFTQHYPVLTDAKATGRVSVPVE